MLCLCISSHHVCPVVIYAAFFWGLLANLMKDRGRWDESITSEKVSRWNVHPFQSNVGIEVEAVNNGNSDQGPLVDQGKLKKRKFVSTNFPAADKVIFSLIIFYLSMKNQSFLTVCEMLMESALLLWCKCRDLSLLHILCIIAVACNLW